MNSAPSDGDESPLTQKGPLVYTNGPPQGNLGKF